MSGAPSPSPRRVVGPNLWRGLRWAAFGVFGLWVAHGLTARKSGLPVGQPAPPLTAVRVDLPGEPPPFDLASWRGRPVVVEFMASWCGVCERMAPVLASVAGASRERPVEWLAVSIDEERATAASVARSWPIPYPVVLGEPGLASRWLVTHLPTVIVLDAEGQVRHVNVGSFRESTLESQLASVGAARR